MPNDVGGRFDVVTLTPELAYQLPGGVRLAVRAPVHWKSFEETAPPVDAEVSGVGDIELLGRHERALNPRWSARATVGFTVPTGATKAQPFVGEAAPTELQLGTGTVDPIASVAVDYEPARAWSVGGAAAARATLYENAHDYRAASVYELGVGGARSFWRDRVRVRVSLDYSKVTHVRIAGTEAANTGRDTIFASPGVRATLWGGLSAELSVRAPLYLRVNEAQFTERALFAARLSYRTPSLF